MLLLSLLPALSFSNRGVVIVVIVIISVVIVVVLITVVVIVGYGCCPRHGRPRPSDFCEASLLLIVRVCFVASVPLLFSSVCCDVHFLFDCSLLVLSGCSIVCCCLMFIG